jgi:hypothetical protein
VILFSIVVTAVGLIGPDGNSASLASDLFSYNRYLDGYVLDLDIKRLAAGTYTLYYKAGNDLTVHSLTFIVA